MNHGNAQLDTGVQSQNVALLANLLEQFLNTNHTQNSPTMNDKEMRKAAYALNLCTVSVSQFIDYNDVNFMEREYEAILNNLNLEEMPKDDALLHILKQLLDVVSFFRIQEGEKKLLEKEYQQKMKNAIWSAVPNIGLIVAGGNPVTMAISLASQVGIGYMNYRKEKAKIGLEQERKEWELQRSAMEQFHGLRRELFDTAWRLADKYHFPDEYRLTERQITQYNRILMDSDDLRRYERLSYIRGNFEAYPPFWYYLGSAANSVYQNSEMYDESLREEYKTHAKKAFKKFLDIKEKDLLREDQLKASCALEYVDLIDDPNEKRDYLKIARKASGNAYDVLELCAMSYLKIGDYQTAAELFRVLVNEDYNTKVNAQLLSRLYASMVLSEETNRHEIEKKYLTLQSRVEEHLFPLPTNVSRADDIDSQFLIAQKEYLRERYVLALTEFVTRYAEEYKNICRMDGSILNSIVDLLGQMCTAIQIIVPDERCFAIPLQTEILKNNKEFQEMLTCSNAGARRCVGLEFSTITETPFRKLAFAIDHRVDEMTTMYLISEAESELDHFCTDNKLLPNTNPAHKQLTMVGQNPISSALLGRAYSEVQQNSEKFDECLKIINSVTTHRSIIVNSNKKVSVNFYCRGGQYFDTYLLNNAKAVQKCNITQNNIIAILDDRSIRGQDLILTTSSITLLEGKRYKGTIPYVAVKAYREKDGIAFGKSVFRNPSVDVDALNELINELAAIQEKYKPKSKDDKLASIIQCIRQTIQMYPPSYQKYVGKTAPTNVGSCSNNAGKAEILQTETSQYRLNNSQQTQHIIRVRSYLSVSDPTRIQIEGELLDGWITVGAYCRLEDDEQVYQVAAIGYSANLKEGSKGQITKYTLKKV